MKRFETKRNEIRVISGKMLFQNIYSKERFFLKDKLGQVIFIEK